MFGITLITCTCTSYMNKNDTETIVKEFLELWQKQFAYMSREGDCINQGLETFTQMQDAYTKAVNAGLGKTENAKSTTTSDIPWNISSEFAKLAKSHAELEGRIAKLESELRSGWKAPAKKTAKNKPARAAKRTAKTNR